MYNDNTLYIHIIIHDHFVDIYHVNEHVDDHYISSSAIHMSHWFVSMADPRTKIRLDSRLELTTSDHHGHHRAERSETCARLVPDALAGR